jgi:hypothetical protein
MIEHIAIPFVLDKTSKLSVRLAAPLELKGEGWRCGVKNFSIEKKWSLLDEFMAVIYTNGYKSIVKPKRSYSAANVEDALEEMFGNQRSKRSDDLFDEITYNDEDEKRDKKEEEEEREVTPPPSLHPFDPEKLDAANSTDPPVREVTPPFYVIKPNDKPIVHELDPKKIAEAIKETKEKEPKEDITGDQYEHDHKRIKIQGMKVVTVPTDNLGQTGYKEYLVYESLKDAFLYSRELPINANQFTEHAIKSIDFTYNQARNRYKVNFDDVYVRAIHLTRGFAKALGFREVIFNGSIGDLPNANIHSHIQIHLNDIMCPIYCG